MKLGMLFNYAKLGALALAIDMGLLFALTEYGGIWYFLSAAISCTAGITANFLLNRSFNFRSSDPRRKRQYAIFFGISLLSLAMNQALLFLLVEYAGLWYIASKIISVGVVFVFSFQMHSSVTFRGYPAPMADAAPRNADL